MRPLSNKSFDKENSNYQREFATTPSKNGAATPEKVSYMITSHLHAQLEWNKCEWLSTTVDWSAKDGKPLLLKLKLWNGPTPWKKVFHKLASDGRFKLFDQEVNQGGNACTLSWEKHLIWCKPWQVVCQDNSAVQAIDKQHEELLDRARRQEVHSHSITA